MRIYFTCLLLCTAFVSLYNTCFAQTPAETNKVLTWSDYIAQVNNKSTPVLVDFSAVWCRPCQMIKPVLQDVAKDMKGKLTVVYIDGDIQHAVRDQAGVSEYPTLLLYKNGKIVWRSEGYMPKDMLMKEMKPFL